MNTTNANPTPITPVPDKLDQLLEFKLQGARYLAKVIDTMPDGNWRLKAAIALTRLTIPAPPKEPQQPRTPTPRSEPPATRSSSQPTPGRSAEVATPNPSAPVTPATGTTPGRDAAPEASSHPAAASPAPEPRLPGRATDSPDESGPHAPAFLPSRFPTRPISEPGSSLHVHPPNPVP
ncbi:MAG: hypothetical protein ACREJO_00210 [Phycisphaerales bacterium]